MNTAGVPVTLTCFGTATNDGRVFLSSFAEAATDWAGLLLQVTREQSSEGAAVDWVVTRLQTGSAVIESVAIAQSAEAGLVARETVRLAVVGLNQMERGEDAADVLSPRALDYASRLVKLLHDGLARVEVTSGSLRAMLTREGAGRAQPRLLIQRSTGSVEGVLSMVSFSGTAPYFNIRETLSGRTVGCYFDEARLADAVIAGLRSRVVVHGCITRHADGSPASVSSIDEVRRLRPRNELPQPKDVMGIDPDLTEGLSAEEWIRRRRA